MRAQGRYPRGVFASSPSCWFCPACSVVRLCWTRCTAPFVLRLRASEAKQTRHTPLPNPTFSPVHSSFPRSGGGGYPNSTMCRRQGTASCPGTMYVMGGLGTGGGVRSRVGPPWHHRRRTPAPRDTADGGKEEHTRKRMQFISPAPLRRPRRPACFASTEALWPELHQVIVLCQRVFSFSQSDHNN